MGGDEQTQDQANWIARKEVDNGLRQFDLALSVIQTYLEPDRPFFLTPSLVSQPPTRQWSPQVKSMYPQWKMN